MRSFSTPISRSREPNYDETIIYRHQWIHGKDDQVRAGAPTGAATRQWSTNPLFVDNHPSAEERRPPFRMNHYYHEKEAVLVCLGLDFPERIFKSHLAKLFAQLCADQLEVFFSSSDVYVEFFAPRRRQSRSITRIRLSACLARVLLSAKHRLPRGVTLDRKRSDVELNRLFCSRKQCIADGDGVKPTEGTSPVFEFTAPPPPLPQRQRALPPDVSVVEVEVPPSDGWMEEAGEADYVHGEFIDFKGDLHLLVRFPGHEGEGECWGYFTSLREETSPDLVADYDTRKCTQGLVPYTYDQWL
jgi:hypothetical protein